jgi:predicted esterase
MTTNIHQEQPILRHGDEIGDADLVVIMLHGRGATAESLLSLAELLGMEGTHFILPQAAANSWYPQSAFGPIEANEPYLSSALERVDGLVKELDEQGVSEKQIVFGGFSQGACLASEYVARNGKEYGGLFVLSGALIGPPDTPRDYPGAFNRMPVFIGGSDVDPWVTHDLMKKTASVFEQMGAEVDFQTYPGMAHTVNQDELERVRAMLTEVIQTDTR